MELILNSHGNENKIDMSSPSVVEQMKDHYDHKLSFIAFSMTVTMRIWHCNNKSHEKVIQFDIIRLPTCIHNV